MFGEEREIGNESCSYLAEDIHAQTHHTPPPHHARGGLPKCGAAAGGDDAVALYVCV
jgi:hypothetical protein